MIVAQIIFLSFFALFIKKQNFLMSIKINKVPINFVQSDNVYYYIAEN